MTEEKTNNNPWNAQANWRSLYDGEAKASEYHACGSNIKVVQFYSDKGTLYDDDMILYKFNGARYAAITAHKYLDGNEDAEILDIGAGSGLVTKELRKLGSYPNIDGLEPAEDFLNQGIKLGRFRKTWADYFYNNCKVIPYESYDVVTCSGCLVPDHLKADCIYEMSKILKKGGIVVIVMRARWMDSDPDLATIPAVFENLVKDGIMEKYEWSVLPSYFDEDPGKVICYKKL